LRNPAYASRRRGNEIDLRYQDGTTKREITIDITGLSQEAIIEKVVQWQNAQLRPAIADALVPQLGNN
jgi:hypothetical protein